MTVSASKRGHRANPKRESPAGVRKWIGFVAQRRPANLKTCKQVRAKYFYEACPSATRADATGVKAPARHPSQCSDPRFRCSMGDVSSTIASSALPPGRLIVRVLKLWVRSLKGNANATPSAHIERITRTQEETTSKSKRSASIWSMQRKVWPNAEANRALKAAIRRIGGKGRYGDLEIRGL